MLPAEPRAIFRFREYPACLEKLRIQVGELRPELGTYEALGRAIGVETRTRVKKMLRGQLSLPSAASEKLAALAGLGKRENEYFHLLRKMHFCEDAGQAVLLSRKLLDLRRLAGAEDAFTELEDRQLGVFEHWYLFPMLFYFSHQEAREASPLDLSRAFMGQVSPMEAEEALLRLKELGLLLEESPGRWRRASEGMSFLEHAPTVVVRNYHKMMIGKALQSVELDPDKRFVSGATFAIRTEHLPSVKLRISEFLQEIVALYGAPVGGEEVHQLQAQFFPLIRC